MLADKCLAVCAVGKCLGSTRSRCAECSGGVSGGQTVRQTPPVKIGAQKSRIEAIARTYRIDHVHFQGVALNSCPLVNGDGAGCTSLHHKEWDSRGEFFYCGFEIVGAGDPASFPLIRKKNID